MENFDFELTPKCIPATFWFKNHIFNYENYCRINPYSKIFIYDLHKFLRKRSTIIPKHALHVADSVRFCGLLRNKCKT